MEAESLEAKEAPHEPDMRDAFESTSLMPGGRCESLDRAWDMASDLGLCFRR